MEASTQVRPSFILISEPICPAAVSVASSLPASALRVDSSSTTFDSEPPISITWPIGLGRVAVAWGAGTAVLDAVSCASNGRANISIRGGPS